MIHLYFNYDLWLFSFFYFVYWHKYFSSRQLTSNESQQTTSCWQLSEFGTISYIMLSYAVLYAFFVRLFFLFLKYSFCSWNILLLLKYSCVRVLVFVRVEIYFCVVINYFKFRWLPFRIKIMKIVAVMNIVAIMKVVAVMNVVADGF